MLVVVVVHCRQLHRSCISYQCPMAIHDHTIIPCSVRVRPGSHADLPAEAHCPQYCCTDPGVLRGPCPDTEQVSCALRYHPLALLGEHHHGTRSDRLRVHPCFVRRRHAPDLPSLRSDHLPLLLSVQDFNLILPIVDTWLVTAFLCDGLTS